jgi:hypothetical protein
MTSAKQQAVAVADAGARPAASALRSFYWYMLCLPRTCQIETHASCDLCSVIRALCDLCAKGTYHEGVERHVSREHVMHALAAARLEARAHNDETKHAQKAALAAVVPQQSTMPVSNRKNKPTSKTTVSDATDEEVGPLLWPQLSLKCSSTSISSSRSTTPQRPRRRRLLPGPNRRHR